jgi:putative membrane protein
MKRIIHHLLCSTMIIASISASAGDTAKHLRKTVFQNQKDTAFVTSAADAGMLEVQLGKLAAAKGSSPEVKRFGESMVADHSKANDELKALAGKKGIMIPVTLSAKSQKKYEALSTKTGADFDRAYADQMVKDHQEVIAKFKQESQAGNDAELKAWAQGKVAVLEHHLMMAQNMQKALTGK